MSVHYLFSSEKSMLPIAHASPVSPQRGQVAPAARSVVKIIIPLNISQG
ncbi:hypothetical protein [Chromobacterium amazonense]|nr:hypothetical protein [Chromobacterium amazonense]MDE1712195.1 hypothetical protein [Chromobacterium amazonense]